MRPIADDGWWPSRENLLLIGVGKMGESYIDAALALGYGVRIVETESWPGSVRPGTNLHTIRGVQSDSWTADEIWAAAFDVAARHRVHGVLAFAEPHVLAAALVQDRLGVPGPSLHAAVLSRNKALQRACFASCGLPQPESLVVADPAKAAQWARSRMPVVVKALSSSGSAGVELVSDPDRVADALAARIRPGTAMRVEAALVEQAVEGPEYSWEGLVQRGEILFSNFTAKETTGPPYFVETTHRCGHEFADPGIAAQTDLLVRGVVAAIGMQTGVVHLEFRITGTGPVIMEVAVRTPGDFILDLIGRSYRFDAYQALVSLAMDAPVSLPADPGPASFTAAWFLTCPPGEVSAIHGLDEVRRLQFVTEAHIAVQVGSTVQPTMSSRHRVGYVLFDAPSLAGREEAMAATADLLRVVTDG